MHELPRKPNSHKHWLRWMTRVTWRRTVGFVTGSSLPSPLESVPSLAFSGSNPLASGLCCACNFRSVLFVRTVEIIQIYEKGVSGR